ncbi:MAG: hypothetical protein IKA80_08375 [Spirochaetaceae bacterium]|nr:hypothetical protein [Spirochaetaceae bacterium]MBQ8561780.1 hypothetical protein [Spirochaetaceae bacterium]MBR2362645.1 hypothetical protein [Spirochaetaceae bacterium]
MPLPFIPIITAVATKGAAVAGTVLASKAAIGVGAAIAVGTVFTVAKITIDFIRKKLKERAEKLRKQGYDVMGGKITKILKSGDYNIVKTKLYDNASHNEIEEEEFKAEIIDSDIRQGQWITW